MKVPKGSSSPPMPLVPLELCRKYFRRQVEYDNRFRDETRRYYSNIVGRYGAQVQAAIKKVSNLPIHMICSLHGLIAWRRDSAILENMIYGANIFLRKMEFF